VGHPGLIPGSGRSPGEGKGYSLQYSINNDYTLQTDSNNLHKFCRKGRNVGNCRYFPQGLTKKISWLQRQEYTTIQEI